MKFQGKYRNERAIQKVVVSRKRRCLNRWANVKNNSWISIANKVYKLVTNMLELRNTVILVAETTPHAVSNLLKNVIKSANAVESSRI